jgi:hypothetical protein
MDEIMVRQGSVEGELEVEHVPSGRVAVFAGLVGDPALAEFVNEVFLLSGARRE